MAVEEEKSEALQCKICLLDYELNNEALTPILLKDCGHTVCEGCAKNLWNQGNKSKILCPFCRKDLPVTNLTQLPKNFALLELLEDKKPVCKSSEDSGEAVMANVPCIEDPSHEATIFCIGCGMDFCEKCFDMLHVSRALAEHLKIPISEKPIQLPKCTRHSYNTAEFACKDPECYHSSKNICHTCLLSDHRGHSYVLLMDVLERNQERLLDNQGTLEAKYQNLKEKLQELRHSAISYDTESPFYAEQIQVITDYFEARKMAAVESFDGFINEKRRELMEKAEQMEYDLEMLKSVKKEVDTVLKTKKNLQNTDELMERGQAVASTVMENSEYFAPLDQCEIHFPQTMEIHISSV